MTKIAPMLAAAVGLLAVGSLAPPPAPAQDEPLTLATANAEEGFALAVELARRAVVTTQPDPEVLGQLRAAYARDPELLIASSSAVADYFAVIAEANDYWRDE